jgi:hypothetical protein
MRIIYLKRIIIRSIKKYLLILFSLGVGYKSIAQTEFYKTQVAFGIMARSIPKYKYDPNSIPFYPFSYSLFVNSKPLILSLDLKRNIYKEKVLLQLSNSITYGLLRRGSDASGTTFNENSLRRDHFMDLVLKKSLGKSKFKYLMGLGYGIMNAGTNFIYSKPFNGNPSNISIPGTLRFNAPRLIAGLEKGVFNFFVIANYTGRDEYYNKTPAFNLDAKLTITFPKFLKLK